MNNAKESEQATKSRIVIDYSNLTSERRNKMISFFSVSTGCRQNSATQVTCQKDTSPVRA